MDDKEYTKELPKTGFMIPPHLGGGPDRKKAVENVLRDAEKLAAKQREVAKIAINQQVATEPEPNEIITPAPRLRPKAEDYPPMWFTLKSSIYESAVAQKEKYLKAGSSGEKSKEAKQYIATIQMILKTMENIEDHFAADSAVQDPGAVPIATLEVEEPAAK